jgi:O-antigen ligase
VLAFRTGGYLDEARLAAAVVAWLLVLAAAAAAPRPLPGTGRGRLAVLGLALFAAWTGLSLLWTPLSERATDDLGRALLYLGAFVAAVAWLRERPVARLAEPALAAGALAVAVYGLSGRLLPDLVEQEGSRRAFGRLEQPLTYWNAMGALAALGLVLCARLAGDAERRIAVRVAAVASAVPLGAALYLTYSRGALAALAVGLAALAVISRAREPLVGVGAVLAATVAGAIAVAVFPAVADGEADPGGQGAAALAVLVALCAGAAVLGAWLARRSATPHGRPPAFRSRVLRIGAIAALVVALVAGLAVALGSVEEVRGDPVAGARAERLRSLDSQRYDYWRVAADTFVAEPLTGVGAGGFSVEWLRERPEGSAGAVDAHSLYFETAAELGLVGLAALLLFAGAVAACVARVLRRDPALAAGPAAALAAFGFHAGIDWDWEMPALTLVALLLAAVAVAAADEGGRPDACNASPRWREPDSQSSDPAT